MQSEVVKQVAASPPVRWARQSVNLRVRGVLLVLPSAGLLAMSFYLTPRKAGYGTHEELGFPPCSFLVHTGYPCPSCGLTTSFAAVAHGDVVGAFLAHPFGIPLFAGVAAVGLAGLGELLLGRDFLRLLRPGAWWAAAVIVGLLVGWACKIAIGVSNGTLPVR